MIKIIFTLFIILLPGISPGQRNWIQEKNENGIKVFSSVVPNAAYKAIKVEASFTGNYSKLMAVLSDVPQYSKWIYHSKANSVVQRNSPLDFIYHTETVLPWPMSNRDVVIHIQINTDSLPKFITITGTGQPARIAKKSGLVRVPQYSARWKVSMPAQETISIHYELELNPGGNIPGWMSNSFVSKGPFETFNNLSKKLKE
jgi:hypothetical protein